MVPSPLVIRGSTAPPAALTPSDTYEPHKCSAAPGKASGLLRVIGAGVSHRLGDVVVIG